MECVGADAFNSDKKKGRRKVKPKELYKPGVALLAYQGERSDLKVPDQLILAVEPLTITRGCEGGDQEN